MNLSGLSRLFFAAMVVMCAGIVQADDLPAVTTTLIGSWTTGISHSTTYGWKFQVNSDISATQLGIWDQAANGLNFAHDVGLWNSAGQLVASTTIPAGTQAALVNDFRYAPITPVALSAGESYVLGAFYTPTAMDPEFLCDDTFSKVAVSASLTAQGSFFTESAVLSLPDTQSIGTGIFGPNLLFHPVPEPSTIMLVVMGALASVAFVWRRGRKAV